MLKKEVVIGKVYVAKVSNNLTEVRITHEGTKGYTAVNLKTNKEIHIKSAAKLRREVGAKVKFLDVNEIAKELGGIKMEKLLEAIKKTGLKGRMIADRRVWNDDEVEQIEAALFEEVDAALDGLEKDIAKVEAKTSPLTESQKFLITYGYPEAVAKGFAFPDAVANDHGWRSGGVSVTSMSGVEWASRVKQSIAKDEARALQAKAEKAKRESDAEAAEAPARGIEVTSVGPMKTTATGIEIKPVKAKTLLYGFAGTAVIRWMGGNGFNVDEARKALASYDIILNDATLKIQLKAGSLGGDCGGRGEAATLTDEQGMIIKRAAGKIVEVSADKPRAKGKKK